MNPNAKLVGFIPTRDADGTHHFFQLAAIQKML
jgi:hypothetical protein